MRTKDDIAARFAELRTLERGWDSYNGVPITEVSLAAAAAFLARIGEECSIAPSIFPTPEGGVQIEFDDPANRDHSLEFYFWPNGEASVLGALSMHHDEWIEIDGLEDVTKQLAKSTIADTTAASTIDDRADTPDAGGGGR